nr:hypothetical protein Iba_chr12fCG9970 [Ipomoea batatas]
MKQCSFVVLDVLSLYISFIYRLSPHTVYNSAASCEACYGEIVTMISLISTKAREAIQIKRSNTCSPHVDSARRRVKHWVWAEGEVDCDKGRHLCVFESEVSARWWYMRYRSGGVVRVGNGSGIGISTRTVITILEDVDIIEVVIGSDSIEVVLHGMTDLARASAEKKRNPHAEARA